MLDPKPQKLKTQTLQVSKGLDQWLPHTWPSPSWLGPCLRGVGFRVSVSGLFIEFGVEDFVAQGYCEGCREFRVMFLSGLLPGVLRQGFGV